MAKRKCAKGGSAKSPQSMKDQLIALRPGYAAGGMPDQVDAFQGRIAPFGVATGATAPSAIPGINAQSLAASLAPDQSGAGVAAPVTSPASEPAAPPAGNVLSSQGGNVSTPGLQTMAEKQQAVGINPNAAYRPGSAQDPHASGLSGVTAAQRVAGSNASAAALAPNQAVPQVENPMDTTSSRQRRQTRTPGLKDGGAVYRKGDTFSDRPMTGTVGSASRDPVATTPRPAQQIAQPVYPQERQAAPQEQEQRGQGMTSAADLGAMLAERRKQISKHSGMADGGMVRHRFDGKGGPRDDQIPVTVAGEKIKVSDGEEAVILPAKTAKSPQAIAQIADVIQQSNDGRPPAMGMAQGGRYAGGATGSYRTGASGGWEGPNRFSYALSVSPNDQNIQAIHAKEAERLKGFDATQVAQSIGGVPIEKQIAPAQSGLSKAVGMNRLGTASVRGDNAAPIEQPDPQIAQTTGNANGATFDPATGNLYFTEKGYDPTKQAMAAGTGAITDPKTGRTIMITGAGVPENPNAPRDQYGNDMTQTLQARDSLMRQRQENALSMMNSPTAGYRDAGQAQMRGLSDVSALDTAATRRAGDQQQQAANVPEMDRKLKGQQIAQGGMAMQQAQRLNDAADEVKNAKTAEEQAAAIATWRALNPKVDDKRFIPQTAKTYDNGMPTGEEVRMFDTQTQRWLSPDSPAAIPEASKRKIGQVYDTPKGKMVWRGNGWEAA